MQIVASIIDAIERDHAPRLQIHHREAALRGVTLVMRIFKDKISVQNPDQSPGIDLGQTLHTNMYDNALFT